MAYFGTCCLGLREGYTATICQCCCLSHWIVDSSIYLEILPILVLAVHRSRETVQNGTTAWAERNTEVSLMGFRETWSRLQSTVHSDYSSLYGGFHWKLSDVINLWLNFISGCWRFNDIIDAKFGGHENFAMEVSQLRGLEMNRS